MGGNGPRSLLSIAQTVTIFQVSWAYMSMGGQGGVLLGRIRGVSGPNYIANPNVWIGGGRDNGDCDYKSQSGSVS